MIVLHESRHLREYGFFRTLFRALRKEGGSVRVEEGRPFPRYHDDRSWHDGAWITWKGTRVFVDMSDHVFQFDPVALREADLYLKANLHRGVAAKVFAEKNWADPGERLQPYTFLAPGLPRCRQIRWLAEASGLRRRLRRPGTLCHVVGVYENLLRDGDPEPREGEELTPNRMHFWIRYHFSRILRERAPAGSTVRLVSRGNPAIEDGHWVRPNLPYRSFLLRILRADALVLNIFPHALDPWKVLEAMALGVPVISEREPLVEVPEAYRLEPGKGRAEVIPGFGDFNTDRPLWDPACCRVLRWPGEEKLREAWERVLANRKEPEQARVAERWAGRFARERLSDAELTNDFGQRVGGSRRENILVGSRSATR